MCQFRPHKVKVQRCTALGVFNNVFVSGLPGLVGLAVHPQGSRSLQYAHASVCRSHACGRCFLFPESFSNVSSPSLLQLIFENSISIL